MDEEHAVAEGCHQPCDEGGADNCADAIDEERGAGDGHGFFGAEAIDRQRRHQRIEHGDEAADEKAERVQQEGLRGGDERHGDFGQHDGERHAGNDLATVEPVRQAADGIGRERRTDDCEGHETCDCAGAEIELLHVSGDDRPEGAVGKAEQNGGDEADGGDAPEFADDETPLWRQRRRLGLCHGHGHEREHHEAGGGGEQRVAFGLEETQGLLAQCGTGEIRDVVNREKPPALGGAGFSGNPAFNDGIKARKAEADKGAQDHPRDRRHRNRKRQNSDRDDGGIGGEGPRVPGAAHD